MTKFMKKSNNGNLRNKLQKCHFDKSEIEWLENNFTQTLKQQPFWQFLFQQPSSMGDQFLALFIILTKSYQICHNFVT